MPYHKKQLTKYNSVTKKRNAVASVNKSPVLQKTLLYIRNLLEKPDMQKLPSVRVLSRLCQASLVTVIRAITILKDDGLVTGIWGKGNYVAGKVPFVAHEFIGNTSPRVLKYKQVLDKLKQDLVNGQFKANVSLPSSGELAIRFKVSYPTIKKVLEKLVVKKILLQSGNKYYHYKKEINTRQRIAVIAFGLEINEVKIETPREQKFYRLLTNAAFEQSVDLEIICYNDYLELPQFHLPQNDTLESYIKKRDICGIILSSYHMKNSAQCLRKLIAVGKPVSIWIEDQQVVESVKKYSAGSKKATFFDSTYSKIPGKDVGTYLLDKGHTHIAFMSPFHGSSWSRNRLQGLQDVYDKPSGGCSITAFVLNEFINDYSFMEKILQQKIYEKNVRVDSLTKIIHPCISHRLSSVKYECDTVLRDNLILEYCKPLIERFAQDTSITALVCVNDLVACLVLDYWNYHKIPISKRPALIGFDNSFACLKKGISSYEFNTGGEVHGIISHILYPNNPLLQEKKGVVRLQGTVVERASTIRQLEKKEGHRMHVDPLF